MAPFTCIRFLWLDDGEKGWEQSKRPILLYLQCYLMYLPFYYFHSVATRLKGTLKGKENSLDYKTLDIIISKTSIFKFTDLIKSKDIHFNSKTKMTVFSISDSFISHHFAAFYHFPFAALLYLSSQHYYIWFSFCHTTSSTSSMTKNRDTVIFLISLISRSKSYK